MSAARAGDWDTYAEYRMAAFMRDDGPVDDMDRAVVARLLEDGYDMHIVLEGIRADLAMPI